MSPTPSRPSKWPKPQSAGPNVGCLAVVVLAVIAAIVAYTPREGPYIVLLRKNDSQAQWDPASPILRTSLRLHDPLPQGSSPFPPLIKQESDEAIGSTRAPPPAAPWPPPPKLSKRRELTDLSPPPPMLCDEDCIYQQRNSDGVIIDTKDFASDGPRSPSGRRSLCRSC